MSRSFTALRLIVVHVSGVCREHRLDVGLSAKILNARSRFNEECQTTGIACEGVLVFVRASAARVNR